MNESYIDPRKKGLGKKYTRTCLNTMDWDFAMKFVLIGGIIAFVVLLFI